MSVLHQPMERVFLSEQIKCECEGVKVTLRRIRREDLKEVHRIMPWGITYEDIMDGFIVRPMDFFGAFLTEKPNQIVSHIKVSTWGNHYCYLGWYVTEHAYRGLGIGTKLSDWARQFAEHSIQLLDADPGMDKVYERIGFRTIRHSYGFTGKAKIPEQSPLMPATTSITDATETNFYLIADYDKEFHAVDRSILLKASLIHPPVRLTKIAVSNEKCVGYACMRSTDDVYRTLCPLIAEDETIAETLLRELITEHNLQGQTLDIYVQEENISHTMPLIKKYGLDNHLKVEKMMCLKPQEGKAICATIPWNKIYGIMFNNNTMI